MSLTTIDNSAIDSMLGAAELTRYIPCLASPPRSGKAAKGCCGSSSTSSGIDYTAIKLCISGLDSVNTQRVKAFFNTKQIRVYRPGTRDGRPVTIKHTK